MRDPNHRNWDRLDNLPAIAMKHLQQWQTAVVQQADRALDSERPDSVREVDAFLLAQALRQVIRAAEMLADTLSDTSQQTGARAAIATFDTDVPAAKAIRDILDHFDDYARGVGNLAHPGVRRAHRVPSEAAAMMFEPECELLPTGDLRLHCGNKILDIAVARDASERLVASLNEVVGLVESTFDEAFAALAPHTAHNPAFVGFSVWETLIKEPFTEDDVEQLRIRVTPESVDAWGDFSEVRRAVAGYAPTTKPVFRAEDIADVKLVPEFDQTRMATTEIVIVGALWMTLQRRPDLDGTWFVHSVGRWPWPTEDMPANRE